MEADRLRASGPAQAGHASAVAGVRAVNRSAGAERAPKRAMRVVRDLDHSRWAAFVDEHPDASIFHTPQMHRVFAGANGHRPAVWAAVDGAGAIGALMTPVAISTISGPLALLSTRAVAYAAPLVAPGPDGRQGLDVLIRAYQRQRSRRALFTEVRNHAAPRSADVLAARGFRHEAHLNYLVDLTLPETQLWERVASSARRNIRKARRLGVAIEEASRPEHLIPAYAVLADVYRRIRVPLPDRSLFEAAFEVLAPLGQFKALLARFAGELVGVLTLLRYQHVLLYWYTGTLREQASCRAGDLLVWHAIQAGRADGCRVLDFGGAGRPDQPYGVRDFKAKYGGELVDFGRDVWVSAPARLRLATAGYELLRRVG